MRNVTDWQAYKIPYRTTPHKAMPYQIIPCHTIPNLPYHTMPNYTMPYQAMPYHAIPYNTKPYHAIPYHTIHQSIPCHPYHDKPYIQYHTILHTTPYHTIPYHTIPYHTIPYHAIPGAEGLVELRLALRSKPSNKNTKLSNNNIQNSTNLVVGFVSALEKRAWNEAITADVSTNAWTHPQNTTQQCRVFPCLAKSCECQGSFKAR